MFFFPRGYDWTIFNVILLDDASSYCKTNVKRWFLKTNQCYIHWFHDDSNWQGIGCIWLSIDKCSKTQRFVAHNSNQKIVESIVKSLFAQDNNISFYWIQFHYFLYKTNNWKQFDHRCKRENKLDWRPYLKYSLYDYFLS